MSSIVRLDNKGQMGFLKDHVTPSALGPEEVLVKVHSCPLNPSDLAFMSGDYPPQTIPCPHTPGFECSGKVVQVSE